MERLRRIAYYLPLYLIAIIHIMIAVGLVVRPDTLLGVVSHLDRIWSYDTNAYQVAAVFLFTGLAFLIPQMPPVTKTWLLIPLLLYTIIAYHYFQETPEISGMSFMWSWIVFVASGSLLSVQYALYNIKNEFTGAKNGAGRN